MADQRLEIWASTITLDDLTETPQRRDIYPEEFLDGWFRKESVSAQQLNQLFYLLSVYANPFANAPVLYPTAQPLPTGALEMNGQTIAEIDYPNAYSVYGATLPNITGDAPTGFTYIIRAS